MSEIGSIENVTLEDVLSGKRLYRCVTHDKGPQTIPIITTDESCRLQELGWFDSRSVWSKKEKRIVERTYHLPIEVWDGST